MGSSLFSYPFTSANLFTLRRGVAKPYPIGTDDPLSRSVGRSSLRYRNRVKITVVAYMCEQKPYSVWFSCRCKSCTVQRKHIPRKGIFSSSLNDDFYTEDSRLEKMRSSFLRVGLKIWNSLPSDMRNVPKSTFRKKLRSKLFEILPKSDDYLEIDHRNHAST